MPRGHEKRHRFNEPVPGDGVWDEQTMLAFKNYWNGRNRLTNMAIAVLAIIVSLGVYFFK
ncbi:hypothetical protein EQG49_12660 [Periweissella cryptocerci]|uniref:Uncharacterized protein n=1 Tax=Periweissella cryptocerci TaxID=2506420 RepID=A0A4P6YWH5_9LACO|nr:hypothetical protein [Periweissella cryptocerci]QBO37249.1 hypothetical protein EQG49_12660 [Periweissella cryptocerci]